MNTKFVTFNIAPDVWADFTIRLEKDKKEGILSKDENVSKRKFNHSRVVNDLLVKFLEGKIEVDTNNTLSTNGVVIKGAFLEPGVWKDARTYIMEEEINGNKVSGGLGGLIVRLVMLYNSKGVDLLEDKMQTM